VDFQISDLIPGFQIEFMNFGLDFWISDRISGIQLDFYR